MIAFRRDGPTFLCRLEEIEEGEGRGFAIGEGADAVDIFVVRIGDKLHGYVNSCPHAGTPLDWKPDRFLNADGSRLMCHTHGALFRIEDGYCEAGPCAGDSLTALEVTLDENGQVLLQGLPQAWQPRG